MGRNVFDSFTEAGSGTVSQLTDHVGENSLTWLPHPDYIGTVRLLGFGGSPGRVYANVNDFEEALYYANSVLGSGGLSATVTFEVPATVGECRAAGNITIITAAGGVGSTLNTLTVNGVNIIPSGAVTYNGDLAQFFADIAAKINNDVSAPDYTASVHSAGVYIVAAYGTGVGPNGFAVAQTSTGITWTTSALATGAASVGTVDSYIGFCYRVRTDARSFYRVRYDGTNWLFERCLNGAFSTLGSVAMPLETSLSVGVRVNVVGTSHRVYIQPGFGPIGSSPKGAGTTFTVTDSAIAEGGYVGIWAAPGGTSTGTFPNNRPSKGLNVYGNATSTAFEAGTNDAAITLPQITLAASISPTLGVEVNADIVLPQVIVSGSSNTVGNAGDADITLPQVSILAQIVHFAFLDSQFPLLESSIIGHIGYRALFASALPQLASSMVGGFPGGFITLPQITVDASALLGNNLSGAITLPQVVVDGLGFGTGQASGAITLPQITLDVAASIGNVGAAALMLPQVLLECAGFTGNGLAAAITLPQITLDAAGYSQFLATMSSRLMPLTSYMVGGPGEGAVAAIVVMNLRTGAITEYSGWLFNSLTKHRGRYLGADANGLYELTGETDAGTAIDADARTLSTDLSPIDEKGQFAPFAKRPTDAYLTYQSDEPMVFSVYVGDDAYDYDVPKGRYMSNKESATVRPHKVELGKGIEANFLQFGVRNVEGGDFLFDSTRALIDILRRRV